jgi:site-specific DNA-methyltransferase (adenine-specific)
MSIFWFQFKKMQKELSSSAQFKRDLKRRLDAAWNAKASAPRAWYQFVRFRVSMTAMSAVLVVTCFGTSVYAYSSPEVTEGTALYSLKQTIEKGKKKPFDNSITLYQNGGIGYVSAKDLNGNLELVNLHKVLIPALGSGSDAFPHPILGKPFVVGPNTACTETYVVAGSFKNQKECQNLVSYLSTRFLRFLVLLKKNTQHATSKVYQFVPVQDFKEPWTDEKLYKKYGITKKEIEFIESLIRPMDK